MESCRVIGVNPFNIQDAIKQMRDIDEFEFTILGESKEAAVHRCIAQSDEVHIMIEDQTQKPVWVWGFGQIMWAPMGYDCVWGFGTPLMKKHKWRFIDRMSASVNLRLEKSKRVSNFVWANNFDAIKGLATMGFTIDHAKLFYPDHKTPFLEFWKEGI